MAPQAIEIAQNGLGNSWLAVAERTIDQADSV
jgi:hypothetical protein